VSGFAAHHFSGSASSEGVKPRARVNCVAKELAGLAVTAFLSPAACPVNWPAHQRVDRHLHASTIPHAAFSAHAAAGPAVGRSELRLTPLTLLKPLNLPAGCAGGPAHRVLIGSVRARRRGLSLALEGHDHGAPSHSSCLPMAVSLAIVSCPLRGWVTPCTTPMLS